jgi:hypothetical protein
VAIEAMIRALGLDGDSAPQRDLGDIAGSWVADADTERALDEQRVLDPDVWQ